MWEAWPDAQTRGDIPSMTVGVSGIRPPIPWPAVAARRLVERDGLFERLSTPDEGVVLVCAPAGSGKTVLLHYREYGGAVAWRGYSNFVVDSIVSITDAGK